MNLLIIVLVSTTRRTFVKISAMRSLRGHLIGLKNLINL